MATLADQTDEPVGLLAIARVPKLGREKGDLVRSINGAPALTEAHGFGGMHIRNKRAVLAMTGEVQFPAPGGYRLLAVLGNQRRSTSFRVHHEIPPAV